MKVNGQLKALERRLVNDELTPQDKEELERVRQVRILRKGGATVLECARKTGQTEARLSQFMRRGIYKLFDAHLAGLERGDDDKAVGDVVRGAKQAFVQFAPDAIDFYRECYKRNPLEDQEEKGIFKDPARAEWATERVGKGLGLTEPDVATRPTIQIGSAIIVGELNVIAADDAQARDAIETTYTVVKD